MIDIQAISLTDHQIPIAERVVGAFTLGRMGRVRDGLGRTLGRIKSDKKSMFIGLGTLGRINRG
jgi:hypothetical protein